MNVVLPEMNNNTQYLQNEKYFYTNSTNTTMVSYLYPSFQYYQLLFFIIGVLLTNAAGAIANVILLLAMAVYGPLRKSMSSVLLIQCIAIDLYATTIAVPLTVIPVYLGPKLQLSSTFCKFTPLFIYLAYSCGMYAEAVVAVHRLIATLIPQRFHFFKKKSSIICLLVIPWLIAVTHAMFPTLGLGSKFVPGSRGCIPIQTGNSALVLASLVVGYYLPTVIIGVCYIIVLGKTGFDLRARNGSHSLRRRFEISRTLFLSFLWHCLTIYPPIIAKSTFKTQFTTDLGFQLAIMWLGNSFCAINPVFFWATSQLFQKGIQAVLRCQWHRARTSAVAPVAPIQRAVATPNNAIDMEMFNGRQNAYRL
ncbi:hypothetical protein BV898_03133 [Hypsibius exemplaris]|uniref:G-protein coupled receptors family 1 profile domain-containing protein n=1 Tax=Hypsibius exemplaris TaxID=2072580 RepID=A0A1W0X6R3_HYPEX|nr:hypothetical protein BV898_03133 [Hypsibius exemplaris]